MTQKSKRCGKKLNTRKNIKDFSVTKKYFAASKKDEYERLKTIVQIILLQQKGVESC